MTTCKDLKYHRIEASTPARIDLAGGTLDIYPVFLFEPGCLTVNAAVNLRSRVKLELRPDSRVIIKSLDLQHTLEGPALKALPWKRELDLILRAIKSWPPKTGFTLTCANTPPKGSGLGASSSLLMALLAALLAARKASRSLLKIPVVDIIDRGADIEAQNLRTLTGKQDYYAAMRGGIQALWFKAEGVKAETLQLSPAFIEYLNQALILTYTGVSHVSGFTNWSMVKAYLDCKPQSLKHISRIKETAHAMYAALKAENPGQVATALNQEWQHRKQLAKGITTVEIEKLIQAGTQAGAWAHKICGAGGGGCLLTLAPPKNRKTIEEALTKSGGKILPFELDFRGLQLDIS